MFAAWLKFACALLCVLALALSGATGEAERIETASDAAPVKYTKSAKSGSALVVSARAGAGCPSAALAKPAPARPPAGAVVGGLVGARRMFARILGAGGPSVPAVGVCGAPI